MIATTESTSIINRIDNIVEKDVIPYIEQWEETKSVPYELIKLLGEENIIYECAVGENNLSNKLYLAEALGKVSLGVSSTVLNTLNIPLFLLKKYANELQKEKYLDPYLQGDLVGAIGITELQGGSNFIEGSTTNIKTFDNHYVLNGHKHFVLNLPGADFVIVLAKSAEKNSLSHTLLIVPTNMPGVTMERIDTSGLQTASFGKISFNNVYVNKEQVLGRVNRGLVYLDEALSEERLVGTFALVSMTKEVLKNTFQYVNTRQIYNGKLSQLQVTRHKLAELSGEFEVASAFIDDVIQQWEMMSKNEKSTKVAMVKIVCTQAAIKVVNGCMQMYGGRGFLDEYRISRQYRDVLGATSFAGTLEMMKEIISNRKF